MIIANYHVMVSIPSGGIILFPRKDKAILWLAGQLQNAIEFPSRLAGLSYFHLLTADRASATSDEGFHPVWRDYPISTPVEKL